MNKPGNKTTAGVTSLGSAIAIFIVVILTQAGIELNPIVSASGTGALAFILNWFIPEKK